MLDYLIPQEIETVISKINGKIKVIKAKGKVGLYVDGFEQSGPGMESIWSKTFSQLNLPQCKRVLVLGLGAAVVVPIINKYCQKVQIIGIEIDPAIIELGKKYFRDNFAANLEVINDEAGHFLCASHKLYDLIIIDLFYGANVSISPKIEVFLKNLTQVTTKNSLIVFNTLTTKSSSFELKDFVAIVSKFFDIEKTIKIDFNTLLVAKS